MRSLFRPRRLLLLAVCALTCWFLLGRSLVGGGAALGLLAAGGWGLALLPVHSNRRLTGPRRRRPDSSSDISSTPRL